MAFSYLPDVEERKRIRLTCRRFHELDGHRSFQAAEEMVFYGNLNTAAANQFFSSSTRKEMLPYRSFKTFEKFEDNSEITVDMNIGFVVGIKIQRYSDVLLVIFGINCKAVKYFDKFLIKDSIQQLSNNGMQ